MVYTDYLTDYLGYYCIVVAIECLIEGKRSRYNEEAQVTQHSKIRTSEFTSLILHESYICRHP